MIQIQCTGKLLKEFDIKPKNYNIEDDLYKWHANLFMVDDIKCIVLINDLALYGFMIYNVPEDEDFSTIVREALEKNLLAQYASQEQVDEYLDNEIVFSKTSSRRVMGKMNALVQYAILHNAYGDENIEILNLKLGEYDTLQDLYVSEYMIEELNKRMPDRKFDRSKLDDEARKMWDDLPEETKQFFLQELHCFNCSSSETAFVKILDNKRNYKLQATCRNCGNKLKTQFSKERLGNYNRLHNPTAIDKWNAIPNDMKLVLINNVFCGSCGVTSIVDFEIENDDLGILLQGKCIKCGNEVVRVVENE